MTNKSIKNSHARSQKQIQQLKQAREKRLEGKENVPPPKLPKATAPHGRKTQLPKGADSTKTLKTERQRRYNETRKCKNLRIRNLQLEAENKEYKTKNAKLTFENGQIRKKLKEEQVLDQKLKKAEHVIYEQSIEIAKLTSKLHTSESELHSVQETSAAKIKELQDECLRVVAQFQEELERCKGKNRELSKELGKLRRQVKNVPQQIQRAVERERLRRQRMGFASLMKKGHYVPQARNIAVALVRAGCSQQNVGKTVKRIGELLGIPLKHEMSRRTVRRCILEAGIAATVQVGYMLAHANAATISSDGTSDRKINYESRHIAIRLTDSNEFKLYFLGVDASTDHSSETQLDGWIKKWNEIAAIYNGSPLAKRSGVKLDIGDIAQRLTGMNGDHASDQKKTFALMFKWKLTETKRSLGLKRLFEMPVNELIEAYCPRLLEKIEDVNKERGPDAWTKTLTAEYRAQHERDVQQAVALEIGEELYAQLPPDEKVIYELFLRGGCCMHKDLNAAKGGAKGLEALWALLKIFPILLANKENTAVLSDPAQAAVNSDAWVQANASSGRGAAKALSLLGAICKNNDTKKGQQRVFRNFFFHVVGYTVDFPDVSNTRYGSYLDTAAMVIRYLPVFITFMEFVRDKKEKPGLTNLEQNVLNALQDPLTVVELCVYAVYGQIVSHPYIQAVRGTDGDKLSVLDLGPLHLRLLLHLQNLIDNPSIFSSPSSSMEAMHLDGEIWEQPDVFYGVRALSSKLPHFEDAMRAFLVGALNTWQRFAEEYREGGAVANTSPDLRARAWMPRTNCINEGALGAKRVNARRKPKECDQLFTDLKSFADNGTEEFMKTHFIDEDYAYLREMARKRDTEKLQEQTNRRLAEHNRATAEKNREKAAKKQQKDEEVRMAINAIQLNLDESAIDGMRTVELEEQLAKLRALGFVTQLKSHLKNNATRKQVLKEAVQKYKATISSNPVTSSTPSTIFVEDPDNLESSFDEE